MFPTLAYPWMMRAWLTQPHRLNVFALGLAVIVGMGIQKTALADEPSLWRGEPAQRAIFWNARNRLRERKPMDVVRLWLLHNSLDAAGLHPDSQEESHFRSALWVALGEMGYCPDGLEPDEDAAGLWTLAMFNWMLRAYLPDVEPESYTYWDTLPTGFQSRPVSLFDVLDAEELESFVPHREACHAEIWAMLRLGMAPTQYPKDRYWLGAYLRTLLLHAQRKLNSAGLEGKELLRVRLFDLNAEMVRLAEERLRQQNDLADKAIRQAGLGEEQIDRYRLRNGQILRDREDAELWRRALQWPVHEWMSLTPRRRISLFRDLDKAAFDAADRDALLLRIVDALLDQQLGGELQKWLGFVDADERKARIERLLFDHARGEKFLSLPQNSGFQEQAVVALQRGIYQIQRGEKIKALRSFAFSIRESTASTKTMEVHALALRWITFVLSQYETTEEVLEIVDKFVPRNDARGLKKVLLWRAALHRDEASFRRIQARCTASDRMLGLITQLEPLLTGNIHPLFMNAGDGSMWMSPRKFHRLIKEYIERLSIEPVDVRTKHVDLLTVLRDDLVEKQATTTKTEQKNVGKLLQQVQVQLDALGQIDESIRGEIQSSEVSWESYAGSVRLAPADPVPWPFLIPKDRGVSPFQPLRLTPVEWRTHEGEIVYGWRIHE